MDIFEWLKTVEQYVPFKKDRVAIRDELYDHYRDRLEALESTGMERREAANQAVVTLGDPHETGRLLRAVHKPWLGWLLRIARVLLFLMLAVAIIHVSDLRSYVSSQISQRQLLSRYSNFRTSVIEQRPAAWEAGSGNIEVRLGDYRISVYAAGNCSAVRFDDEFYHIFPSGVFVVLRFSAPPWYKPSGSDLAFWIEDELGCVYTTDYSARDLTLPAANRVGMLREKAHYDTLDLRTMSQDLTASYFRLNIYNYRLGYSGAKHMNIHIRMGSQECILPVTFGHREIIGDLLSAPPEDVTAAADAMLNPLIEDKQTEIRYLREGTANPVRLGAYEASVPCAREALWYKTKLAAIPWNRNETPRDAWSWQPAEDLLRSEKKVTDCHSELEFVLVLRGPSEALPLTYAELFSHLTLRSADGTIFPLEAVPEEIGDLNPPLASASFYCYQDLALYKITVILDGPSEAFDLTVELDGQTIPLRIVLGEETAR